MKLNMFLMIATVVAGVFGLAFLIVPAELGALYGPGPRLNATGVVVGAAGASVVVASGSTP